MKYKEITEKIIGVFYEVYNKLGSGFLEKVYENAMLVELERLGLKYMNQYPIKVNYKGEVVGDYIADFIIEESVVVEIKAKKELSSVDDAQLLNYLVATKSEVGLLLNFGKEPKFKRKIFERRNAANSHFLAADYAD